MKIPTKQDWGDFKDNPDVKYGYKLFGGKSIEEVSDLFIDFPIERASELRYAPFNIFKYYVHCFINFLTSEGEELIPVKISSVSWKILFSFTA